MGSGSYSSVRATTTSATYEAKTQSEIFTNYGVTTEMNPANTVRECRDSEEHPLTVPIIVALDVTGSMGYVPEKFVREEMTTIMTGLYDAGHKDSQLLFMGIGDHDFDRSPLQVGQFEADDQLLNKWLTDIYLEGGGGCNDGESYLLAWYYAARNTVIDSFSNRGKKGFLFTIGDELNLHSINASKQSSIFGDNGQYKDVTADELLKEASEKYNVFHLHLSETRSGARQSVKEHWKQSLQDNCKILESYKDIAKTIISVVSGSEKVLPAMQEQKHGQQQEDML